MRDDGVRRVQDRLRRAVVLLEPDHACALELLFKREDVLDRRTAEFVDRLIVVADDADIFVSAREQRRQLVLQLVRVLILVDHDVVELLLVIGPHVLEGLEQLDGLEDDVVKVERVRLVQTLVVFLVELRDAVHAEIAGLPGVFGKRRRVLPPVLGLADDGQGQPRRQCLFVQVKIAEDILHHALGIARVVDREAAGIAVQPVDLPPQDAAAGRVERHGPDVHGVIAEQRLQPAFELVGGLVGERDGEDGPRRGGPERAQALGLQLHGGILRFEVRFEICKVLFGHVVRDLLRVGAFTEGDEVRNAVDEDRRFAAARAGQQQQRALCGQDALELHGVEILKARGDDRAAGGQKSGFKCLFHSFTFASADASINYGYSTASDRICRYQKNVRSRSSAFFSIRLTWTCETPMSSATRCCVRLW